MIYSRKCRVTLPVAVYRHIFFGLFEVRVIQHEHSLERLHDDVAGAVVSGNIVEQKIGFSGHSVDAAVNFVRRSKSS